MARLIKSLAEIKAHGNKPKIIQEFVGRLNSETENVSIAKMNSPEGWIEPGQTPEFDEYTIVLKGIVCVETKDGMTEVKAGQSFIVSRNEWVQYSTPNGAEYIAVCIPAFSEETVHRD